MGILLLEQQLVLITSWLAAPETAESPDSGPIHTHTPTIFNALSDVDAVRTFAAGLEQDGAAIRAALTMPWSSGQVEGQINKLKLLKRQTYGRASLDVLRRRMLLAA